jgi:hypothetical protein
LLAVVRGLLGSDPTPFKAHRAIHHPLSDSISYRLIFHRGRCNHQNPEPSRRDHFLNSNIILFENLIRVIRQIRFPFGIQSSKTG